MRGERLSLRAYARWRAERGLPGGTLSGVQKALASGRISEAVERRGRRYLVDPEAADRLWLEQTSSSAQRDVAAVSEGRRAAEQARQAELFGAEPLDQLAQGRGGMPAGPSQARAQATRMAYQALLAKLEYEERSGKLVSAEQVRVRSFQTARMLRDRLMALADDLCDELAGTEDPSSARELLRAELARVLSEISVEMGGRS